ncbi:MAG TPA: GH116 family glycosyl-hydrolase [Armatimonadota bacterium]|jgi:uncharacterized protein (DUF608 family)
MSSLQDLFDSGKARRFSGPQLHEIAFPLGGIGTGTVSLGGYGDFRDWEIFNRPSKGMLLPNSGAAIWACEEGREPVLRLAEAQLQPPYSAGFGLSPSGGTGLPRLERGVFTGAYPFARLDMSDPALPVELSLTAFNPLIPLDAEDSGLPVAILRYRIRNLAPRPVQTTLSWALFNAIGLGGSDVAGNYRGHQYGQNLNEWVPGEDLRGLRLTSSRYAPDAIQYGSLALATTWQDCSYRTSWTLPDQHWAWDQFLTYWEDLQDGRLQDQYPVAPTEDQATTSCALAMSASLEPGESVEMPVVLAWHFPNRTVKGSGWGASETIIGNHYSTRFGDAWSAAEYAIRNLPDLEEKSVRYVRSMLDSTLPDYVLDAAMANVSTLRTQTCMRTADGEFHGFEGCGDNSGCCHGTCTHVWNYEQTTAFMYPSLSRSLRNTEFLNDTAENGLMSFRTELPLGSPRNGRAAADGQMGSVMRLYRDWQLNGDDDWLRQLWPHVKAAVEFAWVEGGWDADRDGVMEGIQHNTYDVEYHGPTPQTGFWYLGALRAAAEMAHALGDETTATTYQELFERGSRWWDEHLFNGEFYIQEVRSQAGKPVAEGLTIGMGAAVGADPLYQLGPGCLSDQLLAQYMASVSDLGYLLDPAHVQEAMRAIYRYNYKHDLRAHVSAMRTYALNDEGGLLICSWPRGGRPAIPTPYADEVWTGIEYIAATSLIYEGLVEEGLRIVETARARHDGARRNPWDEPECGHHYARAMAAWGPILALSGFHWSAPSGAMSFAPRVNAEDFRCFWSTPTAWGSFQLRAGAGGLQATLSVEWGEQTLQSLALPGAAGTLQALVGAAPVACSVQAEAGRLVCSFAPGVTLKEGQSLLISG